MTTWHFSIDLLFTVRTYLFSCYYHTFIIHIIIPCELAILFDICFITSAYITYGTVKRFVIYLRSQNLKESITFVAQICIINHVSIIIIIFIPDGFIFIYICFIVSTIVT